VAHRPGQRHCTAWGLERDDAFVTEAARGFGEEVPVARYGRGAQKSVKSAMRRRKRGTLKSGRSGKRVTSRKQAIAIGLSEAREKGAKVPRKSK
jgi:Family of unknown function (DUF6496)